MWNFQNFYERNYKKLIILPILMVVVAAIIIVNFYNTNGDIMFKDVSLKGGITATVYTDKEVDLDKLDKH